MLQLRIFDVRDSVPSPRTIFGQIYAHIDDSCKDNELIDGTYKYRGLESCMEYVYNKINSSMNRRVDVYVSTDTLYAILDDFIEHDWHYTELFYDNTKTRMQDDRIRSVAAPVFDSLIRLFGLK